MNAFARLAYLVGAAMVSFASAASAQSTTLWVSSTGGGSTCTLAAPCASFQAAHDSTVNENLQINCVDSGNYGTLTITKTVTVDCSAVTANAVRINVNATIFSNVRLRGIRLNGHYGAGAQSGIALNGAGTIYIEDCTIINYGNGIAFNGSNVYSARLSVTDSVIKNNTGNGIAVYAYGGNQLTRAVIERSQITGNGTGVYGTSLQTGAGIIAIVLTDSVISNSGNNGVYGNFVTGGSRVSITLDRSVVSSSNGAGVLANGAEAYFVLNAATVIANNTGLLSTNGGYIFSYRNNALLGNIVDGAPTAFGSLN